MKDIRRDLLNFSLSALNICNFFLSSIICNFLGAYTNWAVSLKTSKWTINTGAQDQNLLNAFYFTVIKADKKICIAIEHNIFVLYNLT